ncbi:MAG: hypothetical protein ABGZ53_29175 [Fuerstiella sp.]
MKIAKQTPMLFLAVSLWCAAGKPSEGTDSGQQNGKPNVLFIAIDDLNDWTDMLKGNPSGQDTTHG